MLCGHVRHSGPGAHGRTRVLAIGLTGKQWLHRFYMKMEFTAEPGPNSFEGSAIP